MFKSLLLAAVAAPLLTATLAVPAAAQGPASVAAAIADVKAQAKVASHEATHTLKTLTEQAEAALKAGDTVKADALLREAGRVIDADNARYPTSPGA